VIKSLFKTALISSPILAMYGVAPAYFIKHMPLEVYLIITGVATIVIFTFWSVNIFLIYKFQNLHNPFRYIASYFLTFGVQAIFVGISIYFNIKPPPNGNLVQPLIAGTAINSLVLIICNSTILSFQKKNIELELSKLKISNLETQKQLLLQQIQPHFLFNALSTLKSLINQNIDTARDYTVKLSTFLRYSLDSINHETITLAEELDFTQNYFDLQKMRFGESLEYQVNIPQKILARKVPVYALQALVENAIKHNSFTKKQPLKITVIYNNETIEVSNNKSLTESSSNPTGLGLNNLNARYKLISAKTIQILNLEDIFKVTIDLL
jgi:two-component system, LytTR family, sensor kinase